MAKFLFLYRGPSMDSSSEPDDGEMAAWGAWIEHVGSSFVDVGAPLTPGVAVGDDGKESTPSGQLGYSIIEAPTLEDAKRFTQNHPFLRGGHGDNFVDIFEALPIPM